MKALTFTIAVIGSLCAAPLQASDDVIVVERSLARPGVGPQFAEKAEKELAGGDFQGARRDIETAIRNDPTYWAAFYTRAKIFVLDGKWSLAIQDCNQLLRQDSTFIPAALLRSTVNFHMGNYAAASKELDYLVVLHPRLYYYARALDARAWFRATCPDAGFRKPQQAIRDATSACNITNWLGSNYIDTLAVAFAAAGDFDSAVRYEQQAMKAHDSGEIKKTLEQHIAMFRQRHAVTMR